MTHTATKLFLLALFLASVCPVQAQEVIQPLYYKGGGTIGSGPEASFFDITDVNGTVYFNSGEWFIDNRRYWIVETNGTQMTTERFNASPGRLYNFDGTLIRAVNDFNYSDGSFYASLVAYPGGTIKSFGKETAIGELAIAGGMMFFPMDPAQLWKSDGTEAGTVLVSSFGDDLFDTAEQLVTLNNTLFFETTRYEFNAGIGYTKVASTLWISDGTEAGTVPLLDSQGRTITFPTELTPVGQALFFAADDPDQAGLRALWKSDGTPSGTSVVQGGFPAEANFDAFAALGNTLFFSVDDGTHGQELWKSNGTAGSTMLIADLVPGPDGAHPTELTPVGSALFFVTSDAVGKALWRLNGTAGNPMPVKDGFLAEGLLAEFTDFDGTLYFIANDGVHGNELWKSDGTEEGTRMVEDLVPGPASAFDADEVRPGYGPGELTVSGGKLYFAIGDRNEGSIRVLWPIPDMVGYWPLNGAMAPTPDASGHGLDGALQGEPGLTDPYLFFEGHSLAFDGTDDFVSVEDDPALDLTTGLTLMGWFKHSATGGDNATGIEKRRAYRLLVKENDQAASTWMFDLWTAAGTFYRLEAPAPVYNDLWHHVAATYDGRAMKLYIDGVLVGSRTASGAVRTTGLPLEIGRRDGARCYAGLMDEVRLYGRALAQEEIQYLLRGLAVQACFTAEPASGPAPLPVKFDASCTYNPYGLPIWYSWRSEPASLDAYGEIDPEFYHMFGEPGRYVVTLDNAPDYLDEPEVRWTIRASREIEVTGDTPAPTGLVAAWPFSEGSGTTAEDASPNDHTLTLLGGTTWTNGPSGTALLFDGQDDFASAGLHPDFDLTSALTLSAWFNPSANTDNATGLDKRHAYRLLVKTGTRARFLFDLWDEGGTFHRITSASSYDYGMWHHVAATFDGSVMRLYVDGQAEAQEAVSGAVRVVETPLELGRRDGSKYFRGSLDEVRLYGRALTAEEVGELASGGSVTEASLALAAEEMESEVPSEYALEGNYPNPFNPSTEIRFGLPEAAQVTLVVYDVRGREVAHLVQGPMEAGYHTVAWQASEMPSGVYLYRLQAGSFTASKTMVLLK